MIIIINRDRDRDRESERAERNILFLFHFTFIFIFAASQVICLYWFFSLVEDDGIIHMNWNKNGRKNK